MKRPASYRHVTNPYPSKAPIVIVGLGCLALLVGVNAIVGRRASNDVGSSVQGLEVEAQQVIAAEPKIRVGLQAGHWEIADVPTELESLRWNGGASAGGYDEVDVNLDIARKAAALLKKEGIEVDVLMATVPESYRADAFISIHADGNDDTSVTGYKAAASEFDSTEASTILSDELAMAYGEATDMILDPNVTEDMTRYYSFNYVKFHASVDPSTPSALIETGFITNASDRKFLINKPDIAAKAIADGVLSFLEKQKPTE